MPGGGDGVADGLLGRRVLAADVEVAGARPDGDPGDGHGLDQRERVSLHEHAVLEGAGLGLVGVAQEVLLGLRGPGDGGPLRAGGERGAAAAGERGEGDLVDDPAGPDGQRAPQPRVPAGSAVGVEVGGVDDADVGEQVQALSSRLRGGHDGVGPRDVATGESFEDGGEVGGGDLGVRRLAVGASAADPLLELRDRPSRARCRNTAGARSHIPRHGLRVHVTSSREPAGPRRSSSAAQSASPPNAAHATSSHTCAVCGARGVTENSA